jgi:hypothetical protein
MLIGISGCARVSEEVESRQNLGNQVQDTISSIKAGEKEVTFGSYTWRVLDVAENKALLITDDVVESRAYNSAYTSTTWEKCTLRQYLNGEFYNKFSDTEKSAIIETTLANNNNTIYGTVGGNNIQDKVFLLSIDEADQYFTSANERSVGAWWWLRSPGLSDDLAANVYSDGSIIGFGYSVNNLDGGVRPALYINLNLNDTISAEVTEPYGSISIAEENIMRAIGELINSTLGENYGPALGYRFIDDAEKNGTKVNVDLYFPDVVDEFFGEFWVSDSGEIWAVDGWGYLVEPTKGIEMFALNSNHIQGSSSTNNSNNIVESNHTGYLVISYLGILHEYPMHGQSVYEVLRRGDDNILNMLGLWVMDDSSSIWDGGFWELWAIYPSSSGSSAVLLEQNPFLENMLDLKKQYSGGSNLFLRACVNGKYPQMYKSLYPNPSTLFDTDGQLYELKPEAIAAKEKEAAERQEQQRIQNEENRKIQEEQNRIAQEQRQAEEARQQQEAEQRRIAHEQEIERRRQATAAVLGIDASSLQFVEEDEVEVTFIDPSGQKYHSASQEVFTRGGRYYYNE